MEIPPAPKHRWPFQPLMDAAKTTNLVVLGETLGVHPRQLTRWRSYGVTDEQAEHLAMRLGLLPDAVWDDWFNVDLSSLEAEEEAERRAVEARAEKKRARDRAWAAAYRQREAARIAEYQRAYRSSEAVKDMKRRYSRSYYRRNRDRMLEAQRRRDRRKRETS